MLVRKVNTVNGSPKKKDKKMTTPAFTLVLEIQHGRQVAKKKGKKKTTIHAFTLIRKVNTIDGSPKKREEKDNNSCFYLLYWSIGSGNSDCPSSKSR